MQPPSITRRFLAPLVVEGPAWRASLVTVALVALAGVALLLALPPVTGAVGAAPGQGWQEAPAYLPLFTPRLHRAAYTVYTSAAGLDDVLRPLATDTTLLRPPGAWQARATTPSAAFGEAAEYNRWQIARLYGATRARVARGARVADGRVPEAWTLISPYPDPDLERLNGGTLLIVLRMAAD